MLPHFANECLSMIKAKNFKWPEYDTSMLKEETINVVIQINGKKKNAIEVDRGITQEQAEEICKNQFEIDIDNAKKVIFLEDKLINIVI